MIIVHKNTSFFISFLQCTIKFKIIEIYYGIGMP
nr:MAG TPA: hypothetical protein [Caudoviricetes sp.]